MEQQQQEQAFCDRTDVHECGGEMVRHVDGRFTASIQGMEPIRFASEAGDAEMAMYRARVICTRYRPATITVRNFDNDEFVGATEV